MEIAVLRGQTVEVQHFADHVIAERGVWHGRFFIVPVDLESDKHAHGSKRGRKHLHTHMREAG